MPTVPGRIHCGMVLFAIMYFHLNGAISQASESSEEKEVLQYRMVEVLHDDLPQVPAAGLSYVPMKQDLFERLVREMDEQGTKPSQALVRMERTVYAARLVQDRFLEGMAQGDVVHDGDQPSTLLLNEPQLPLGHPRWDNQGNPEPARLGRTAEGQLMVLVNQTGLLSFDWSLAGERTTDGVLRFELNLMPCAATELYLELPPGLIPMVSHGLVRGPLKDPVVNLGILEEALTGLPLPAKTDTPSSQNAGQTGPAPFSRLTKEPQETSLQRWQIVMGGRHTATLHILPESLAMEPHRRVAVRQTCHMTIDKFGIRQQFKLHMDVRFQALNQLQMDVAKELHVTSVALNGHPVSWSIEEVAENALELLVIEFNEPVRGRNMVLELTAFSSNAEPELIIPWIHPRNMLWQQGTAQILVDKPLQIVGFRVDGCRPTSPLQRSLPDEADQLQLELFRPNPMMAVTLATRPDRVEVRQGTNVQIGESSLSGRTLVDFRCFNGERYRLLAFVPGQWTIDSIDADPAGMIADWEHSAITGQLRIQLKQPIAVGKNLRLIISGKHPALLRGQKLGRNELCFAQFEDVEIEDHLVSISCAVPRVLKSAGILQVHTDLTALSEEQISRLDVEEQEIVFSDQLDTSPMAVWLSDQEAQFTTEIQTEVVVGDTSLREIHHIRVLPEYVDRLRIRFSQELPSTTQWAIVGEPETSIHPQLLKPNEGSLAATDEAGETWELGLRRPRRTPFVLQAIRSREWKPGTYISLPSVTNAERQSGKVEIRVAGKTDVLIENSHLQAIPADFPEDDDGRNTLRAVFRFDPAPHAIASSAHALAISPVAVDSYRTRQWLRRCHVESWFEADGFSRHRVRYELENWSSSDLQLMLPSGTTLRNATVNTVAVSDQAKGDDGQWIVKLPEDSNTITLVIELEHQRHPLRLLDSLQAPIPIVDAPCLEGQWRIALPPGFEVSVPGPSAASSHQHSWRHRFFGSWAREDSHSVFFPWKRNDSESSRSRMRDWPVSWSSDGNQVHSMGLPIAAQTVPQCAVHDQRRLKAVGWACQFIMAVAVWWWSRSARRLWIAMVAICATGALVVPASLIPIFSGIFLGTLLGGALIYLQPPRLHQRPPHPVSPNDPSTVRQAFTVGLVGMFVGLFPTEGLAAVEPVEETGPRRSPMYQVLVPVNAEKEVVGDYYHVPKPVFQALRAFEQQTQRTFPDWMVYSLVLQTRLDWEVPDRRLWMDQVKVTCDLETFVPQRWIRLNFRRSEMDLVADTAHLDGRPVTVRWTADGQALELLVTDAGPVRLELLLQLRSPTVESFGEWSFDIPKVANSKVLVDLPPKPPGLEWIGATGMVYLDDTHQQLRGEFGNRERLTLRWLGGELGNPSRSLDVEQLYWLRINPQSVVLDAQLTFRVLNGKLRIVSLITDPRLRLLPLEDSSPVQRIHEVTTEDAHRVLLELDEPTEDVVSVTLSFLVTETRGIGEIPFPRVETEGNTTRCWLAVSGHPSLIFPETELQLDAMIPGPEFVRDWGGTLNEPPRVYDQTDATLAWPVITVRPIPTETQVSQRLTLVYGEDQIELRLDVDFSDSHPSQCIHTIRVPDDVVIRQILISDKEHSVAARWSRPSPGLVHVFPSQWNDLPRRITLHGEARVRTGEPMDFPSVSMNASTYETDRVIVARRNNVSVNWEGAIGQMPVELPSKNALAVEAERIVGVWELDRSQSMGHVTVKANDPLSRSVQVSKLIPTQNGRWWLEIDHHIALENGFFDQLVFELGAPCGEPESFQSEVLVAVEEPSGEVGARKQVRFQLPETIRKSFHLSFRVPLTFAPGQRIHVPHVHPVNTTECTHYVVLPKNDSSAATVWDTPWMIPAKLPAELLPAGEPAESSHDLTFLAIDPDFRAEQRSASGQTGVPQIQQADIQVHLPTADTGRYSGHISFDLEPTGIESCRIQLPADLRLIHASIGGLPARMRRVDNSEWDVALVSAWLPQRIEIEFTGDCFASRYYSTSARFMAPIIQDIDVQTTLWTVSGPSSHAVDQPYDTEYKISLSRQHVFRMRALTELMELSAQVVGEQTPEDVNNWYRIWVRRYGALRKACRSSKDPFLAQELTVMDSRQLQIASHLGTEADWDSKNESSRMWSDGTIQADRVQAVHMMFHGNRPAVEFKAAVRSPRSTAVRWSLAGLLVVGVLSILRWKVDPWTHWIVHISRWPAFHGVLIGIVWWLWLTPSWLGMVIVLGWLGTVTVTILWSDWTPQRYRVILQRRP